MRKNTQSGFSLVELMVVVAIIGILATVAIPKVNKFIAKARTAEAQTNLASLYTFNKNFYVEFQGYTNSFGAMGFAPEGNLRYSIGWATNTGVAPANYKTLKNLTATTPSNTTDVCGNGSVVSGCQTLAGSDNQYPTPAAGSALDTTNFLTFTAIANANLVKTLNNNSDVWSVNETKNLINISDGTQ